MYLHPEHFCVSLLQYSSLYCPRSCLSCSSLCFTWTYLFNSSLCCMCQKMAYSSLWCTWTVCLQEPVLHRDVSVYKSFCVHLRCLSNIWSLFALMRVCLQELLCAPEVSVDYIEPVLHLSLSVYNLCSTWKCLSSKACAAFVPFCVPELCSASVLV